MQKNLLIALAVLGTLTVGYLVFRSQQSDPITSPPPANLKNLYNQWKVNYKINVGAAEDDYRFKVFSGNYAKIQSHNKLLGRSYSLGLNPFSHLTHEEFAATHLGLKIPANYSQTRRPIILPTDNLQTKVDWSKKMSPPKNQGQCGSCWAFSTVGAVEGLFATKGKKLDLAEQELVDCSTSFGNQGCNGGLMDNGFQYIISVGGLASEKDYPYTAADGDCKKVSKRDGKITSFADVTVNSADALKAALNKQPVSVAIEADTFAFQGYTSGVITSSACGTNLDHGVVAVGYNDEDRTPYYKVRNSWGESWGEQGYVRIGITDGEGICGIQMAASYPIA